MVGAVPTEGFAFGNGPGIGSNNWVVSGDHTATGMPLLANDMHLSIQMPSIWYEIGLHAPGWDVSGFSFAGVPGIISGHNNHIAWGHTNVGPDVQDLFIEKINPLTSAFLYKNSISYTIKFYSRLKYNALDERNTFLFLVNSSC